MRSKSFWTRGGRLRFPRRAWKVEQPIFYAREKGLKGSEILGFVNRADWSGVASASSRIAGKETQHREKNELLQVVTSTGPTGGCL